MRIAQSCLQHCDRCILRSLAFVVATTAMLGLSAVSMAQSGTKAPVRGAPIAGSATKTASPVAMSGYCPVCVIEMKKWIKGDPRISASYDGQTYLFPSTEQREMFVADPAKYTPAMSGLCTVCRVEMGKDVPGSVQFSALHQNRLFLFPGDEQKQMFLQNPGKYADVDLAAAGNCTVCRVEMQQDVLGSPEFTVLHKGLRYQFPGPDQQKMFIANPAKYEVAAGSR